MQKTLLTNPIYMPEFDDIGHPKKKAMAQALEKTLGNVTEASSKVGISRSTHYNWIKADEKYREAVEDISNATLDYVESKLFELIDDLDKTAIIFYLKTKGKRRGYSEYYNPDSNLDNKLGIMFDALSDMRENIDTYEEPE